jgi:hypothetical protein
VSLPFLSSHRPAGYYFDNTYERAYPQAPKNKHRQQDVVGNKPLPCAGKRLTKLIENDFVVSPASG